MIKATTEFLLELEALAEKRKNEILFAKDNIKPIGKSYYISNSGNDDNSGLSPENAWKTLSKVSSADLTPGDAVLFCRGDIFRGFVQVKEGVTYAAYGEGAKPRFYGWDKDLADASLWKLYDPEHSIWKLEEPILDCGTLVFNHGEAHSRKLIPSYVDSKFVCRDNESKIFDLRNEMVDDLDLVCLYDERTTTEESKGKNFPVPLLDDNSYGELYLKCNQGNPAKIFSSIEAVPRRSMFIVGECKNVTIDNLCLKYIGIHAIAAGGHVVGLHVSNCEIGWIGGTIQNYLGTDPNYPQGDRGSVTRYGNGIEIYGGCEDYVVADCYIYQVYDAGITHQITTNGNPVKMTGIRYVNNLVEYCVYSIEYFLEKTGGDTESYIDDIEISGNILRFSGYGWGQQRHNKNTPAHIKGWSYENTASNYSIYDNIFDRSAFRMLHLVAKEADSCPAMSGNTYVQSIGNWLGQYGSNKQTEPDIITFDETADEKITLVFGDNNAKIYYI